LPVCSPACLFLPAHLPRPTRRSSDLPHQKDVRHAFWKSGIAERIRWATTGRPIWRNRTVHLFWVPSKPGHAKRCCPNQIGRTGRSEEHTSELQSRENLVCRLLLENKE